MGSGGAIRFVTSRGFTHFVHCSFLFKALPMPSSSTRTPTRKEHDDTTQHMGEMSISLVATTRETTTSTRILAILCTYLVTYVNEAVGPRSRCQEHEQQGCCLWFSVCLRIVEK
ncbi:unnamed protein product [Amoebophrya sp. A25]|nr:unnamed protein product [Amoebophrya sp. A25]|eukprot:GSA25T00026654001.1